MMVRGVKKQSPLGQALYAHSHHTRLALLACLQLSRIIGKASGGGSSSTGKIIFINGTSEPYTDLLSMISFSDQFCFFFFLTKQ